MSNKKITRIPPRFNFLYKTNVAIYCRVSTSHPAQLESLSAEIEIYYYKSMVRHSWRWELVDVYSDICSNSKNNSRPELQRIGEIYE